MDQPPAAGERALPAGRDRRRAPGRSATTPLARLAAGRVDAFVATAGYLRAQGSRPRTIVAADAAAGLAVLEDLGDDLFAAPDRGRRRPRRRSMTPRSTPWRCCTPSPPPARAGGRRGVRWPLLTYDDLALQDRRATSSSSGARSSSPAARSDAAASPSGTRALGPDPGPRRGGGQRLLPPRLSRREPALAARARRAGPRRPARLPGRGAGPSGLGPVDAAAGRPARRLAGTGGGRARPLPRRALRGRAGWGSTLADQRVELRPLGLRQHHDVPLAHLGLLRRRYPWTARTITPSHTSRKSPLPSY